jgi:hypothetical protein
VTLCHRYRAQMGCCKCSSRACDTHSENERFNGYFHDCCTPSTKVVRVRTVVVETSPYSQDYIW